MRRRLAILAFGAIFALHAPAWADAPPAMKAFEEGRKLRDHRDFEKAAAAFERSIAAEPSIGAFYNLGFSFEQLGRTRDALDAYRQSAALAREKHDPREKEASEAVAKLLDAHNYVVLKVGEEIATTAGMRIVVDGELVPPKQYDGEVFRSASQHEIIVSAPAREEVRTYARNREVAVVALGEAHAKPAPAPVLAPSLPSVAETTSSGWGWQRWAGAGMVAGGVVSLAVTAIIGLPHVAEQRSLDAEAEEKCPGGRCPDNPETRDLVQRNNENVEHGRDIAPVVIATGVIGAGLVGAGLYLFFTAPRPSAASPSSAARVRLVPAIGGRDNGLAVVGSF